LWLRDKRNCASYKVKSVMDSYRHFMLYGNKAPPTPTIRSPLPQPSSSPSRSSKSLAQIKEQAFYQTFVRDWLVSFRNYQALRRALQGLLQQCRALHGTTLLPPEDVQLGLSFTMKQVERNRLLLRQTGSSLGQAQERLARKLEEVMHVTAESDCEGIFHATSSVLCVIQEDLARERRDWLEGSDLNSGGLLNEWKDRVKELEEKYSQ